MNLLRSICCLFAGPCSGERPKPTKEDLRGEQTPVSEADLGQREAELEKASKEQFRHMDTGEAS